MSSILDALKKAERDSAADDGKGTPWPALPVDKPPGAVPRRRLWIFLGGVLGICVIACVIWLTLRAEPDPRPMVAARAVQTVETKKDRAPTVPGLTKKRPESHIGKNVRLPKTPPQNNTAAAVPPMAKAEKHRPRPTPAPDSKDRIQPAIPVEPSPRPEPTSEPAESFSEPSATIDQTNQKTFRNDDRIDLQALVWAPEAEERFVVINNRLIKEGGSVDNITVVKINEDDVLFSEGNEQWYQAFNIR